MNEKIIEAINDHKAILRDLDSKDFLAIENIANNIIDSLKNHGCIFWCGNGGSASQANHLSAELTGGMYKNKKKPFNSICLNTDISFITAWSNDESFDNIFLRQVQAHGKIGDTLIALSTSGNSKNIINAIKYAKANSIDVISMTGNDGGDIKTLSDINFNVKSNVTARIQEFHILAGHLICDLVENSLE
tara:strand:- start:1418 stop:1987 length:570 start_codon:yes stop_codon:yes gene_type:complete